ncbi:MAG: hypothetical protein ACYS32_04320, partial [Planctomycetota bacterium]
KYPKKRIISINIAPKNHPIGFPNPAVHASIRNDNNYFFTGLYVFHVPMDTATRFSNQITSPHLLTHAFTPQRNKPSNHKQQTVSFSLQAPASN